MIDSTLVSSMQNHLRLLKACWWCTVYATGVVGMLVVCGALQERIMTIPYGGETFRFPALLIFCSCAAGVVFAAAMAVLHGEELASGAPLWKYLAVALSNVFASTCQYESLRYVSFAVQMLSRSSKVMPTMLWNATFSEAAYSFADWLMAAGVTAGVIGFLTTGPTASPVDPGDGILGFLWLLAFLALDCLTSQLQEELFREHKASKYNRMLYVNLLSCSVSAMALTGSGELSAELGFGAAHGSFVFDVGVLSATAVGGHFFVYSVVREFGTVVFAAVINVRQAASILVSYVAYRHPIAGPQLLSLFVCFFFLFCRSGMDLLEATLCAERKPLLNAPPDVEANRGEQKGAGHAGAERGKRFK